MKSNKSAFNYCHFPVGTICEVKLPWETEKIVTVNNLMKNGPDSYVIDTDHPGTVTPTFSCNINWVTRIIKKGQGSAKIDRSMEEPMIKEYHRNSLRSISPLKLKKPKSKYLTIYPKELVFTIVTTMAKDEHVIDIDKLMTQLELRGVLQRDKIPKENKWASVYPSVLFCSKKKLKRAIKQLFNKCLSNHKKAQKENDDIMYNEFWGESEPEKSETCDSVN